MNPIDKALETSKSKDGLMDLTRLEAMLSAVKTRNCVTCGQEFESVGLTAYCTPCGLRDEEDKASPTFPLGPSWPTLQGDKCGTDCLTGKGLELAKQLAPKMMSPRLLVLAGDRGRGKTQIATYIAWYRGQNGRNPGLYTRAYDMAESICGYERDERLQKYQKAAFLVIDECHRLESKHLPLIESIVDDRYSNKRSVIIIGNWTNEQEMLKGGEVDGEKLFGLGYSMFSRVNEHANNRTGGIVWCKWDSYRNSTPDNEQPR